ncbi:hypothetical protein SBOR_4317 [Sclerotinia borealis F-4128]|uniref:Uncharacterized protein n=1 Tax=Sclerotinia borealis (strain F-4128) TaxID=1432307 RepID=W9CLD0_SCLBF|nr:hypothetical protein SBOR_4317 [Sclerotinia borealis F-4128]
MPSQRNNEKAQQRKKALDALEARREAAEKKELDMATKADAKTTEESVSQAGASSSAVPVPSLDSLPRIKKKTGTSMAEKRAAEEVAAAEKQKRERVEKEEGEITSDDEYINRLVKNNKLRRPVPEKTTSSKAKSSVSTSSRASKSTKDQTVSNNMNTSVEKVQSEAPQGRRKRMTPQEKEEDDLKILGIKTRSSSSKPSSKHRRAEEADESSGEEIAAPARKRQTTEATGAKKAMHKGGNSSNAQASKGKRAREAEEVSEEEIDRSQKRRKESAPAPAKRTPSVKETKYRLDPNAPKVMTFGAPQPSKKKVAPKKALAGPAKIASVSEKKEVSKKAEKKAPSSTTVTATTSKSRTISGTSTSTRPLTKASTMTAESTQSPPRDFTSVSDRIKSRRRGTSAASGAETIQSSSSVPSTVAARTVSRSSRSSKTSSVAPSTLASRKSSVNRLSPPTLSRIVERKPAKRLEQIEEEKIASEMQENTERESVEELKEPESAVELDSEQDTLLKADFDGCMARLDPKTAAVVQEQQQEIDRVPEGARSQAVEVNDESEQSVGKIDESNAYENAVETTKAPSSPNLATSDDVEEGDSDHLEIDFEEAFKAEEPQQSAGQQLKNLSAASITSPHISADSGALTEQPWIATGIDSPKYTEDGVPPQNRMTEIPSVIATYERGYVSDSSDASVEDPDSDDDVVVTKKVSPVPTPVLSDPFEEGNFDELELDLDRELEIEVLQQDHAKKVQLESIESLEEQDELDEDALEDQFKADFEAAFARKDNQHSSSDTSFSPANALEASVEQPSSSFTANDQVEAEVSGPKEATAEVKLLRGLPPLDEASNLIEPCWSPDDSDSDSESDDDVEMLENGPSEVISVDDIPQSESAEDEDSIMLDVDNADEIFRRNRVPVELATEAAESESMNYDQLIANVRAKREETMLWEEETQLELSITFELDRAGILRELGVSEERISAYMETHQRYENVAVPEPAKPADNEMEVGWDDNDDDDSSDDVYLDRDKVGRYQGFLAGVFILLGPSTGDGFVFAFVSALVLRFEPGLLAGTPNV